MPVAIFVNLDIRIVIIFKEMLKILQYKWSQKFYNLYVHFKDAVSIGAKNMT